MTETVIATGDNVKFIEGVTQMNQANWQEYFGSQLENRVIEGFNPGKSTDATAVIYDGSVFVNGIYAKLELEGGSKNIYVADNYDAFLCLRVYLNEEKVELVKKTVAVSESYIVVEIDRFISDESYQCTRNSTIYEIPLFYCGANYYKDGVDLRRYGNLNKNLYNNRVLQGNNTYVLKDPNQGADYLIKAYIDYVNEADDVDVYLYSPNGSSGATFSLSFSPYVNGQELNAGHSMLFYLYDSAEWTYDSTNRRLTKAIASNSVTHIKVKLIETSTISLGGGIEYINKLYSLEVL